MVMQILEEQWEFPMMVLKINEFPRRIDFLFIKIKKELKESEKLF